MKGVSIKIYEQKFSTHYREINKILFQDKKLVSII